MQYKKLKNKITHFVILFDDVHNLARVGVCQNEILWGAGVCYYVDGSMHNYLVFVYRDFVKA